MSPQLSSEQEEQVRETTNQWVTRAVEIWSTAFDGIPVHFDLRGRASGMFCFRNQQKWIRFNPFIFARHFEESLASTVPHEVAHYICFELHGGKPKPHGKEWKAIMRAFGVPANATCQLDISDLPQKRLKRYIYHCQCSQHELTSIRHNRIVRGVANYACPKCQTRLIRVEPD